MKKATNDPFASDSDNKLILYTDKRGDVELRADVEKDTMWATLNQIADIFRVQKAAISKHLKNIYASGELRQNSTVSKMETVQTEGGRSVRRSIEFYNLDAIIAVGYRVNSTKATKFRIWATRILHQYLVNGFNVSERTISRSSDNVKELQRALAFMGSDNLSGALKGKLFLRVSKEVKE